MADVAVIGIPHDDWGEAVHAVVNLKAGQSVDETALIAWGRSRLAGYKTPKSVTFSQEPLPRNSAGKLARAAVVERVKKTIAVRADR